MKKRIALFTWWLDTAAQLTMLLGVVLTSALAWWPVALYLLFFLGVWQLGSGVIWGIVRRDQWRLLYVASAITFLFLAFIGLPVLFQVLPTWGEQAVLGIVSGTVYVAACVFLWHTYARHAEGDASLEEDGLVPGPL